MTPEQIRIYKAMSPAEKLELIAKFNSAARELKAASLRMLHPEWPEKDVQEKVRELFLYASN